MDGKLGDDIAAGEKFATILNITVGQVITVLPVFSICLEVTARPGDASEETPGCINLGRCRHGLSSFPSANFRQHGPGVHQVAFGAINKSGWAA